MRIIVSRKYMPFSSLVLIVGTGFKGSWQKMLFLERRNLQLKVGQLEEEVATFLTSFFPVASAFSS